MEEFFSEEDLNQLAELDRIASRIDQYIPHQSSDSNFEYEALGDVGEQNDKLFVRTTNAALPNSPFLPHLDHPYDSVAEAQRLVWEDPDLDPFTHGQSQSASHPNLTYTPTNHQPALRKAVHSHPSSIQNPLNPPKRHRPSSTREF